jgi:hypothetical protein
MSDAEFNARISKLLQDARKRFEKILEAERGDRPVKVVTVKGHWVPRYCVKRHTRVVIGKAKETKRRLRLVP